MAVKVGWTQADLDTLRAALASGVLTVSYSGPPARSITYQSAADMRRTLSEIVAELADTAGTRQTFRYGATRKGF